MKRHFFLPVLTVLLLSCSGPSNETEERIELPQFAENCPTFDDGLEYALENVSEDVGSEYNDSLAQPGYGPYTLVGRSNLDQTQINASIIRPDLFSNELKWSDTLINASRLTIVYESVSDSTKYSFDVTGKESHMLKTGKVRDDMRIWNVKLQAEFNYLDGITIFNNELWNQHFRCGD